MRNLSRFLLPIILLSLLPGLVFAAEKKPPLQDTPQWIRLSRQWRALSEHWQLREISRQDFKQIGEEINASLPSLISLEANYYFDTPTRTALEDLLRSRCAFIWMQRYELRPSLVLIDVESSVFIARSNIEDDLARLLWPPELPDYPPEKIREFAHRRLAVELEFLRRAKELKETIASHRAAAQKKQEEGEAVNWDQFNYQAAKETRALIDLYNAGKIEPGKETKQLHKLVLSLTEEPLPPADAIIIEEEKPTP